MSLFPQVTGALAVCVIHHVAHLIMDGYLVGRLRPPDGGSAAPEVESLPVRRAKGSD